MWQEEQPLEVVRAREVLLVVVGGRSVRMVLAVNKAQRSAWHTACNAGPLSLSPLPHEHHLRPPSKL